MALRTDVLDSSRSGGSTPAQYVHYPLPGTYATAASASSHSSDNKLEFTLQLFLDHSMTEVSSINTTRDFITKCIFENILSL